MKFDKKMLLLYAVTERKWVGRQSFAEQLEDALKGGVTMVQLREKDMDRERFAEEAVKACRLCHQYGVPFIVNDDVEAALQSGADGVHVGIEDAPVAEIRKRVPKDFIIGATCKTVEQAKFAEASGADYMGVGAVFPSPTKKNAVRITNELLREITSCVSIPAVAIGGITYDNVTELKGSQIAGVAVVSAIFAEPDIVKATGLLKKRVMTVIDEREYLHENKNGIEHCGE